MSFCENSYLSWYLPRARRGGGAIDLHSSGVARLNPEEFEPASAEGDPWGLIPRLEASLAEWLDVPADEVVFTPGATGGNLLALLTLVESGQHVLVEQPTYEPMLRQAKRVSHVNRLFRRFDQGWRIPLEQTRRLVGADTAMVIITEPHNPSGVCSPRDDVIELADAAAAQGAMLVINEVYRRFTEQPSYHGAADNVLIVGSLSKLFGTYAMRLGWVSAPKGVAERLRCAHMNMTSPATPCAAIGLSVMARAGELEAAAKEAALAGHPVVRDWVERTEGLSWHEPHGTGFGCVRLPCGVDDLALVEKLHHDDGVLLVPGSKFEAPGSLRIAWLQSGGELEEGLRRVADRLAHT